jgi:hypothetical protein
MSARNREKGKKWAERREMCERCASQRSLYLLRLLLLLCFQVLDSRLQVAIPNGLPLNQRSCDTRVFVLQDQRMDAASPH